MFLIRPSFVVPFLIRLHIPLPFLWWFICSRNIIIVRFRCILVYMKTVYRHFFERSSRPNLKDNLLAWVFFSFVISGLSSNNGRSVWTRSSFMSPYADYADRSFSSSCFSLMGSISYQPTIMKEYAYLRTNLTADNHPPSLHTWCDARLHLQCVFSSIIKRDYLDQFR